MRRFIRRTVGVIWRLVNVVCFIVGALTILLLLSAGIAKTSETVDAAVQETITEEAKSDEAKEQSFVEKKAEDLADSMTHPEYLFRRNSLGSMLVDWDKIKGSVSGLGEKILRLWTPAG